VNTERWKTRRTPPGSTFGPQLPATCGNMHFMPKLQIT
jgi:hypothetical protein